MRKLFAKDLKIKFIETLNELDEFSYEEGNPFLIKIGTNKYFVFLKNLSPAYFKNSPDITRVQLPYSEHFSKILKQDIPFIILGYDVDTDIVVSWNPMKIKERLNAKSNVSLYSRYSLQEQVKGNEFKFGYLSNGEKIVLFKKANILEFFNKLNALFSDDNTQVNIDLNNLGEPVNDYSSGRILELTDKVLLSYILPLLKKNKVLEAVEVTSNYYSGNRSMSFKDWYELVSKLYKDQNK